MWSSGWSPWRAAVALAAVTALLVTAPAAAVRDSREPLSRGDLMRKLHGQDLPDDISLVRVVQTRPGQLDLAGTPRAPAEPVTVPAPTTPKGLLPGPRGSGMRGKVPLWRRRRRRPGPQ